MAPPPSSFLSVTRISRSAMRLLVVPHRLISKTCRECAGLSTWRPPALRTMIIRLLHKTCFLMKIRWMMLLSCEVGPSIGWLADFVGDPAAYWIRDVRNGVGTIHSF